MKEDARSRTMRAVKSRDTGPELVVRRVTHGMGYRYRLHRKDLPGRPDMAFPARRKAIFVHGCFWHRHDCSRGARTPKSNRDYWIPKLRRNEERDEKCRRRLAEMGWRTLVIWECETKDLNKIEERISKFLDD